MDSVSLMSIHGKDLIKYHLSEKHHYLTLQIMHQFSWMIEFSLGYVLGRNRGKLPRSTNIGIISVKISKKMRQY